MTDFWIQLLFLDIIHYPLSCFYLKNITFRWLDSVSVFRWNLFSWAQAIELIAISGQQHKRKIRYVNQAQHKPSARVKRNIKRTPHIWCIAPIFMHCFTAIGVKISVAVEVTAKETNSLYGTNIKTQFSHWIYTGRHCSFLNSAAITGVQVGEMSKLGWLIRWSTRDMWEDSLYFLCVVLGSISKTFASFQHILCLLRTPVGLILTFEYLKWDTSTKICWAYYS
jgi:hypothetical protein